MKLYLSKLKKYNSQLVISIGVGINGLSQMVTLLLPSGKLLSSNFQDLANWQSISLGFGLLLSSSSSGFIFNLMVSRSKNEKVHLLTIFKSLKYVLVLTLAISIVVGFFVFKSNASLLVSLTVSSIILQLISAIQRATYSGLGDWMGVAFQMGVEGFVRLISVLVLVYALTVNELYLIVTSIFSQILGIWLTTLQFNWYKHNFTFSSKTEKLFTNSAANFLGLTAAGALVISMFTVPILTLLNFKVDVVNTIALLLVFIRIPSTVLGPLLLPTVREVAFQLLNEGMNKFNKYYFVKVSKYSILGLVIYLFLLVTTKFETFTGDFTSSLSSSDYLTISLLAIASMAMVLESFFVGILTAIGEFKSTSAPYFISIPLFIALLYYFNHLATNEILLFISISLLITVTLLARSLSKLDLNK